MTVNGLKQKEVWIHCNQIVISRLWSYHTTWWGDAVSECTQRRSFFDNPFVTGNAKSRFTQACRSSVRKDINQVPFVWWIVTQDIDWGESVEQTGDEADGASQEDERAGAPPTIIITSYINSLVMIWKVRCLPSTGYLNYWSKTTGEKGSGFGFCRSAKNLSSAMVAACGWKAK